MIDISSNITEVVQNITSAMDELTNEDQVTRIIAQSLKTEVHDRIHERGEDSNNSQIGEYSNSYMALRTGNYKNADKTKKGKLKNAGTYTEKAGAERSGTNRPKYNRTNDKKVVLSLTRQMENDFSVIATANGYGLGFQNDENFNKSQWAEKNYNKIIYNLTEGENKKVVQIAEFEVNRLLND